MYETLLDDLCSHSEVFRGLFPASSVHEMHDPMQRSASDRSWQDYQDCRVIASTAETDKGYKVPQVFAVELMQIIRGMDTSMGL